MKGDRNQYSTAQQGQTTKLIQHLRKVACLGPRLNLNEDPDGVRQRIADYFALCEEDDIKPSMSAMATAMGLTRRGLHKWRMGIIGKNEETRELLNQAAAVLAAVMEGCMLEGMINPVSGIFIMRNNYGYKNEDVPDEPDEKSKLQGVDLKALEQKYKADIPDDIPDDIPKE